MVATLERIRKGNDLYQSCIDSKRLSMRRLLTANTTGVVFNVISRIRSTNARSGLIHTAGIATFNLFKINTVAAFIEFHKELIAVNFIDVREGFGCMPCKGFEPIDIALQQLNKGEIPTARPTACANRC